MTIDIVSVLIVIFLIFAALWATLASRLIKAVIALAVTSMILSIAMYRLNSPLAAVFELTVCAGLISVIFITTISFTSRLTKDNFLYRRKERLVRFWLLPFILLGIVLLVLWHPVTLDVTVPIHPSTVGTRDILWNWRRLDLIGQVVILLAGALGVIVFFKERKSNG